MSFEEIAYHINEEHDFAGLMLIHDRVKQLIIRVKKVYGVRLERKNYRVVLDRRFRDSVYVNSRENLSIENNFSKSRYKSFYKVSEFTAKGRLKNFVNEGFLKKDWMDDKKSTKS